MLQRPFPRLGSRYTYAFGSPGMSFLSRMNLLAVDEGNVACSVNAVSSLAPPPLTFGGVSTLCQHYLIRAKVPPRLGFWITGQLTPTTRRRGKTVANTGHFSDLIIASTHCQRLINTCFWPIVCTSEGTSPNDWGRLTLIKPNVKTYR